MANIYYHTSHAVVCVEGEKEGGEAVCVFAVENMAQQFGDHQRKHAPL